MRWRRNSGDNSSDDQAAASAGEPTPDGVGAQPDAVDASGSATAEPQDLTGDATPFEATEPRELDVEVAMDLGEVDPVDLERATRRAVARALAEDLGDRGDVTSLSTIPPGMAGSAELIARADGVVAGVDVVEAVFEQVDARVEVDVKVGDGDRVQKGDVLGTVTGPLRSILTGERTALNFLCHLSGIATRTAAFVDAVAGTPCAIRDTRKTTPGLRLLEKAAVKAGGGHNHRVGLYDAILVKDNHIAAAGSVSAAAKGALGREGVHVQLEVADLNQLEEALNAGVTDILLDNFTPEEIRQAIQRVGGRAALEASGNITLDNVRAYANTGVGRVAIGAITHSAPNLDIALDIAAEKIDTPSYLSSVWTSEVATAKPVTDAAEPELADAADLDVASEVSEPSDDDTTGAESALVAEQALDDRHAEDDVSQEATSDPVADVVDEVDGAVAVDEAAAVEDLVQADEAQAGATDDADEQPEQLEGGALFAWRDRQLDDTDGD